MLICRTILWHSLKVKWSNEPVFRLGTYFLPSPFLLLSVGKQKCYWGDSGLPLFCLLKSMEERWRAIGNCPPVLGLRSICSLNLCEMICWLVRKPVHIFLPNHQRKTLWDPSMIFPIYYHYFRKKSLKKTVIGKSKCWLKEQQILILEYAYTTTTLSNAKTQFTLSIIKDLGDSPVRANVPALSFQRQCPEARRVRANSVL